MAVVELIYDLKTPAWVIGNTDVPKFGEPVYLTNGTYALGDNVTQVQNLTFYGGTSAAYTGSNGITLTGNNFTLDNSYFTGEASVAAGVVTLSNSAVISKVLTGYVSGAGVVAATDTILQAIQKLNGNIAAIPTGLVTGTTTITSGTNTRILYNNAGVVGEYLVTGTGTTAVLSTSPVFGGKVEIGAGATGIATSFSSLRVGVNNGLVDVGSIATGYSTIWLGQATPSASNYSILMSGSSALTMQASSSVQMSYAQGTSSFTINATGLVLSSGLSFNGTVASSGSPIPFEFKNPANTNQTTTVNSPSFKVTGSTKQWATGALATQYFNYFSANTVSFVGASTATNVYGLYVEAATAGTNATITNNYAAGFGGNVNIIGAPYINGVAPTGTGSAVLSTSPTFTTDITTPLIIGGTAVGSGIIYKGTTGNGTASLAAHSFTVGNNGNFTALEILHSGLVNTTTLYASSNINVPIIYGGTSSGGTLTLGSTEHATKGNVYLGSSIGVNFDQVNTRLGVGIAPTAKLHLRSTFGANGGFLLDLSANSGSADTSYTSFDFKVPTTGLISQFLATASNYSAAGVNLAANSVALLSYATSGQLALGAGGSSGYCTITCGGYAAANEGFRVDANLNVTIGNAALATNATNGFLYVTSCAGTPTGVPTAKTGRIPIVADATNNKLYIYSGGAWVALN